MTRAFVRKVGSKWSVRVGRDHAKVSDLGTAKRTAEAFAQAALIWERQTEREWHGREMTHAEFERNRHIYFGDD